MNATADLRPPTPAFAGRDAVIVRAGKRKFVSGVIWRTLHNQINPMKEAKEWSKDKDLAVVVIRTGTALQGGFVKKGKQSFKGMYSLATVLAEMYGPSFLGVFKVDDGQYAVAGVYDGNVVPGMDFVGSETEVIKELNKKIGMMTWKTTVAPESFGLGGEELDLKTVLAKATLKSNHKLVPLQFGMTRRELLVLGGLIVTGAAIAAGWLLHSYLEEQEWQEQQRLQAEAAKRERERLSKELGILVSESALLKPWTATPTAANFVRTCDSAIGSLPLSIGGWQFTQSKCSSSGTTNTYTRTVGSTNTTFRQDFEALGGRLASIKFDEVDQTVTFVLQHQIGAGGDFTLHPIAETHAALVSQFQALAIPYEVKAATSVYARQPTLPDGRPWPKDMPIPAPGWQTRKVSFTTAHAPAAVADADPSLALRLSLITARLSGDTITWTNEGWIYGK
ncbi:type 4b pilus protein PilO2 [Achromobacter ruhlandii]|uniref:type 4b pilus protein PilO2 n=1 Tax=Achromobacter ruhlandii TaxID=72557 RepID=UPI003B9F083F